MFDDAGNVATKQLEGYNADAMSVSLKQVSGNLKHAPAQGEISESAMKVKDTLEDIIGDRAHVVISDSMNTSEDGKSGTRALLDSETGVFYVNNKFQFDETFTEQMTAIHELYHYAEGTKQSAELSKALREFGESFKDITDAATDGGDLIIDDLNKYKNDKLNAAQQNYVWNTEIDADILGKLLGSEEYVAKLAVRNENLVKKLYTYLKAAGKSTQSKQVRRALDKLTKKFGNALDHAKGGVLVSQIGDEEEKESTATSINEENMQVTVNDRASLSKTKIENLKNEIVKLGQLGIKLNANGKVIKILTDKFTEDKNIFSKKGRTLREVNARIKAIPYFNKILKESKYSGTDTNIRGLDSEAKKGVVAMHSFKGNYGDFEIEALIRDKGAKQFLYEIKFIENEKSSQQSMTDKSASPAPKGDVENNAIISQADGKSNTFEKNSSKKSSSGINDRRSYAGVRADTADHSLLSKAQEMLDEGYDSETVRKETGWFKGYDGKWRFEIDDFESSTIENPNLERHEDDGEVYFTGKLSDIFDHKELFEAYPELMDINIVVQKTEFGVDAIYQPNSNYITLSREHFKRYTKAYNEYLNGGRKTEIEQIEQTPEFKEYNKWYDDEIADNMEPLAWLEGEFAARNRFFSSDLGKRYYQLKYSKDGFTGEKFELGWDKGAKEVLLHELQHAVQKIEGFAAGTNTRDKNYDKSAGEIEAFDTGRRANLTAEQRKNTRPDIDREDVVVKNVIGDSFLYIGDTKDDRRCYVSGFDSSLSMDEKIKLFKERIATIFNLGAVELKTDVKKIIIKGDKFTAQKNIYGDFLNTTGEQNAKINSLYDLADILATSKYDPNSTQSETSYVNPNVKPKNAAHKGVKYWYKFKNNIVFDNVPYTVTFNIRDKGKEQYQYLIEFKEDKTPGLSNTAVKNLLRTDQASYTNSIPQNSDLSTEKSNINERSSKTGKDTIEMSKGEIEKLRANYMSEKVFDKKVVSDALNGITIFKKLPSDVRGKLIESIWTGFNEHRAYDRYIEVTTERLYATIMQESDFALYELDVKESKDAEAQLKDEIKLALQSIVDGAKESTYAKMQRKAYAEVEQEVNALKAERDKLKKKNDENDAWTKSLTSLLRKIKTLEDKNSGKYVSASQYNLSTFKGAVKALGKVIWRGDINVTSARKHIATLSEWYGEIDKDTHQPKNTMLAGIYSEDVAQSLKDIATEKGKLTVEELDKIRDIADHFIFVLENDKKVFLNGKYEDAPAKAKEFVKLIQSNAGKDIGALRMFWNTYLEYCGDPMMIFRRMDKYKRGFWTTMGEELRAAAAGAAIFEMETRAPIEEFLSKHKKFLNDLENKTVTYNGTEIPLGIGMNLYCTLKREQAQRGLML